jgi:hypothetical protein
MLASMRHLLRFIDLDSKFDAYGFVKKVLRFKSLFEQLILNTAYSPVLRSS